MDSQQIKAGNKILQESKKVLVLTGAGVSAESGVPTFRGEEGLWKNYDPMELATPEAFARDPYLVWEWYDWRREKMSPCKPNPSHQIIAEMEKGIEKFLLVTQNVDGLHQKAGSKKVVTVHGNIWETRCTKCETIITNEQVPLDPRPPVCVCGGMMRPNVVWFGEIVPQEHFFKVHNFIKTGDIDCFIIAGTTALIHYIQTWTMMAKEYGAKVIEVNFEPTVISRAADISLIGKAGEIFPQLWGAQ